MAALIKWSRLTKHWKITTPYLSSPLDIFRFHFYCFHQIKPWTWSVFVENRVLFMILRHCLNFSQGHSRVRTFALRQFEWFSEPLNVDSALPLFSIWTLRFFIYSNWFFLFRWWTKRIVVTDKVENQIGNEMRMEDEKHAVKWSRQSTLNEQFDSCTSIITSWNEILVSISFFTAWLL